jgi:hypothetical protein
MSARINEPLFLAGAGERDKALAIMAEIEKSPEKQAMGTNFDFWMACVLGRTGNPQDRDAAFRYLDRSTTELHAASATYGTEPFLDPLRSDPRFAPIIKKVGFPIELGFSRLEPQARLDLHPARELPRPDQTEQFVVLFHIGDRPLAVHEVIDVHS